MKHLQDTTVTELWGGMGSCQFALLLHVTRHSEQSLLTLVLLLVNATMGAGAKEKYLFSIRLVIIITGIGIHFAALPSQPPTQSVAPTPILLVQPKTQCTRLSAAEILPIMVAMPCTI